MFYPVLHNSREQIKTKDNFQSERNIEMKDQLNLEIFLTQSEIKQLNKGYKRDTNEQNW